MDKSPSIRGREGSEGDPGGLPKRRKKSALERLVQEAEQMPPPKNDERTGRAKRHAKQKAALEEKRAGKRVAPAAKSDNEAGFSRKRPEGTEHQKSHLALPGGGASGEGPDADPEDFEHSPIETKYEVAAPLLKSFGKCFPEATKLIQRYAEDTMELVTEAAEANVTFVGYSEDVPEIHKGSYTQASQNNRRVCVTKTETDPILAMRHFLFELTNGINVPAFNKIRRQARKGELTREAFAYNKVAIEAEGTIRMAKIWEKIKPKMIGDGWQPEDLDKYDRSFWSNSLRREKDTYIENLLGRKFAHGTLKGKTMKERYMEQFDELIKN